MTGTQINPLEEMVEELAPLYVEYVNMLAKMFAPNRPWWTQSLTKAQQLWRWQYPDPNAPVAKGETPPPPGPRWVIMPWLEKVAPFLAGLTKPDDLGDLIEKIFTPPGGPAEQLIPLELIADVPTELLEMVQASGPFDAAKHIANVEKWWREEQGALGVLASTDVNSFPLPPEQPPIMPTDLGTMAPGWPGFGGVEQGPTGKMNIAAPGLAGQ